jgi:pyruvate dehydrogenase E2 component (dihydrolipoamide acetyltransferase)
MGFDFKLPDLGENVESGDVVSVLVKEGDQITPEQSVFEIEAGKSVLELPCPQGGTVTKIHVAKGAKVKVGETLLSLDSGNGSSPKAAAAAAPAKAAPAEKPAEAKPAPKEGRICSGQTGQARDRQSRADFHAQAASRRSGHASPGSRVGR